jgi:hypothetical protein
MNPTIREAITYPISLEPQQILCTVPRFSEVVVSTTNPSVAVSQTALKKYPIVIRIVNSSQDEPGFIGIITKKKIAEKKLLIII